MLRARAVLLLCFISLLWGSGWIFTPQVAAVAQPFAAAALTMALAAVLLLCMGLAAAAVSCRLPPRAVVRSSLVLGLAMLGLPTCLLLVAGARGLGGLQLLMYALLPLLTGFLAERWPPAAVLGAGAVFLLIARAISFTPRQTPWVLLVLAAVGLQAWALRYASRALHGTRWSDRLAGMAVQATVAAALLGIGSLVFEGSGRLAPMAQWTGDAWLSLAYLVVAGTVAPYLLLYRLLARGLLHPEQVATGQWLQTLCIVGESAYLVRAHVPWLAWAAAAVLLGCTASMLAPVGKDEPLTIAR